MADDLQCNIGKKISREMHYLQVRIGNLMEENDALSTDVLSLQVRISQMQDDLIRSLEIERRLRAIVSGSQ